MLESETDTHSDPRFVLQSLAQKSRSGYAGLSRLIGRNPAYIQQFVKRGTPKKLDERDRAILANHFKIEGSMLGAPCVGGFGFSSKIVERMNEWSSKQQIFERNSKVNPDLLRKFNSEWLQSIARNSTADLHLVLAEGSLLAPMICHGDYVLLDRGDLELRDGIYALAFEDTNVFRRVSVSPHSKLISLANDNSIYPPWVSVDPEKINVFGRAIWVGRYLEFWA